MTKRILKIGLMGLGHIGRKIFHLAMDSDDIEIVAVEDVADAKVLHYLLQSTAPKPIDCRLDGQFLVTPRFRTRILRAGAAPSPWDVFEIDCLIDCTGRLKSRAALTPHLAAGAPRVVLSYLPSEDLDRVVISGINEVSCDVSDRLVSAGSATTCAFALMLQVIDASFGVELATMTTVHAYSSDQSLQDYAGADYRRSRSAAENIIPNSRDSPAWVERLMPALAGRLGGYALNVPVQQGSLLDVNYVLREEGVDRSAVNAEMQAAAIEHPALIAVASDPIVSSDVIGCPQSVLFDMPGTMRSGKNLLKTLSWYESLGQAHRVLDVVRHYASIDQGRA